MSDYLIKVLAFNDTVRAYAIRSTAMVQEAARRQDTWRTATAALGRTLSAGAMMGAMLKGKEKITIKIEGNGPAAPIIVDANALGEARGYISNPHVDPERKPTGKLNVSAAVGEQGSLSVVKDLGLKEKFTGSVPLVSGELAEDFTYYFASSEQTPSSVALGVIIGSEDVVEAAGGFVVQMMPGATEETIEVIEARLNLLPPISTLIMEGCTPEEVLYRVLGEQNVRIVDKMPVSFRCNCSKERISQAIMGLGKAEVQAMIDEDQGAETRCHFCNEVYLFSKDDLEELLEKMA
ncbi:molecular chaperone Hsp33 [Evansella caseinilytica]|uniref:33 kDa chaperonin n=1 Tax=Evansella caseinilytica TaxID=1503961 RepID=A0A1H3UWT4_9BACI|nr:Hsp33 family molecular chaperone HslO [Evansella caseinilytica]SDZ66259.1 molecular chaperone Hsp33 [Evansella caseinilytica]